MATEKKKAVVAELTDMLSRSTVAILTVPSGLTVAESTDLRKKLREVGVDFRVVKNTLASLAAHQVGKEALDALLSGPTGIAFGYGDEVAPARALIDYTRASKVEVRIKGGIIGSRLMSAGEAQQLALLPGREVLLAQLLGGLQAPVTNLVWVLKGNIAGLMNVLQGRADQLEKAATA